MSASMTLPGSKRQSRIRRDLSGVQRKQHVNLRLRRHYLGEDADYCIHLKGRLPDFIEAMLDGMNSHLEKSV